jgi:DNA-binding transcriptional ArsR family regulator
MVTDRCERRIIHLDNINAAGKILQKYPDTDAMVELFKALSDPGRLQILIALDSQEMCVCDLAALLGVSESAASHQMRILRTRNLVKSRREGQVLYYRLIDEHVMQLVNVAWQHVQELKQGVGSELAG